MSDRRIHHRTDHRVDNTVRENSVPTESRGRVHIFEPAAGRGVGLAEQAFAAAIIRASRAGGRFMMRGR